MEPVTMNLNEVTIGLDTLIRSTLTENIDIEVALAGGLWKVRANRSSTESAILNLVINARDAMSKGGKLTIETSNIRLTEEYVEQCGEEIDPGRYVMIAITDTREGIPPENLDKVFEPFFRTKPIGKGTGLSLSSIIDFVRQSGGMVRIYSELGVGTTVKVYFRAAFDAEDVPTIAVETPVASSLRGKILLVEDEAAVRKVMMARLQIEGYSVVEANNASVAIKAFETQGPFELIVTDVVMPGGIQGPLLVAALRTIEPSLKAIFISDYPNQASINRNGIRVEDIKLMKPVSEDDLLRALSRLASPNTRKKEG